MIGDAETTCCGGTVTPTDDDLTFVLRQECGDLTGTAGKGFSFENPDRAIPEYGCGGRDFGGEQVDASRAYIEKHGPGWRLFSDVDRNDGGRMDRIITCDKVDGQHQFWAGTELLFHLGEGVWFGPGCTHRYPSALQNRVGQAAATDDSVEAIRQVAEHANLVSHLGASSDDPEGAPRMIPKL